MATSNPRQQLQPTASPSASLAAFPTTRQTRHLPLSLPNQNHIHSPSFAFQQPSPSFFFRHQHQHPNNVPGNNVQQPQSIEHILTDVFAELESSSSSSSAHSDKTLVNIIPNTPPKSLWFSPKSRKQRIVHFSPTVQYLDESMPHIDAKKKNAEDEDEDRAPLFWKLPFRIRAATISRYCSPQQLQNPATPPQTPPRKGIIKARKSGGKEYVPVDRLVVTARVWLVQRNLVTTSQITAAVIPNQEMAMGRWGSDSTLVPPRKLGNVDNEELLPSSCMSPSFPQQLISEHALECSCLSDYVPDRELDVAPTPESTRTFPTPSHLIITSALREILLSSSDTTTSMENVQSATKVQSTTTCSNQNNEDDDEDEEIQPQLLSLRISRSLTPFDTVTRLLEAKACAQLGIPCRITRIRILGPMPQRGKRDKKKKTDLKREWIDLEVGDEVEWRVRVGQVGMGSEMSMFLDVVEV
ncbi:hypothetical protein BCR33DRAFT_715944 [Rhizoclosmatium globosum]|uniref:Uncharacterized protein n=1 Tax=Rhizoclosmatium globosum TaxID=329046 RepID=A0A1Y2CFV8_9FUNG|nr:hypothetical protein BCR33DRAFT_715944 [Rhizoclosmatium globosum]|eukprot:ORY45919.1 hypothetical protein BCR33DRAFT_715944 [Rhizoclosmatium globosum]